MPESTATPLAFSSESELWAWVRARRKARRGHAQFPRRTLAPPKLTGRYTLSERALTWFLPWTVRNYPGLQHGLVQLFGLHVSYSAIKGWRTGRRNMPDWAAATVANMIEARCRTGMDIVAELRAYRAPQKRPSGFCTVGPEGSDKRNRIGQQRPRERDGEAKLIKASARRQGEREV
jgi:hypothetical protein